MSKLLLVASFSLALLPLGGAALLVQRQHGLSETVRNRINLVTASFGSVGDTRTEAQRPRRRPELAASIRLERAFGFDRKRRSHRSTPFVRVVSVAMVAASSVALVLDRIIGPLGASISLPLLFLLPRLFYRRCDSRYTEQLFKQFPDALSMIVRAVRVGIGLGKAVMLVAEECQAPTSHEFRQLSEEIAIGRPLPDALRAMSARNRLPEYRFFATALSLQSQTGGGLAETLETLADTIRKRVAIKLRGHALAAEARLSCYVLGGLPFAVGGFLFLSNPGYVSVLFTTAAGEKLLGFAILLLSLGLFTMQTLTKRILR